MANQKNNALEIPAARAQPVIKPAQYKKLIALVHKTQIKHPKASDVNALRQMLAETPGLWRTIGDLAQFSMWMVTQSNWLSKPRRLAVDAGISDLKRDLGYPDAPPLEKMLINQIIVSWLQLQKTQLLYETCLRGSFAFATANYWEHRLTASSDRYLRTVVALARFRKLSRPSAVQVNIAKRQVNIAQSAPAQPNPSDRQIRYIRVAPPEPPPALPASPPAEGESGSPPG